MNKGIIFDLDGTLLNTSKDLAQAVNTMRAFFMLEALNLQLIESYLGEGIEALVLKSLQDAPSVDKTLALKEFQKAYHSGYNTHTQAYPHILDLLESCVELGYRLAVVSNKQDDYTQTLIQAHFADIPFVYVSGKKENLPFKPDPEALLLAIKAMNLSKEECWMVGDSEVDIESARRANIPMMAVTWGYRTHQQLKDAGAKICVHSALNCLETLTCV